MAKYAQGIYQPQNPEKYIGRGSIKYRSSWELAFMLFADNNPAILQWASESISIPYRNPLTNKNSFYIPDFLIVYVTKTGKKLAEVVEIKPRKETFIKEARSQRDKLTLAVNLAKWAAAQNYCKAHGMGFRVVNEDAIFHTGSKRR
jgi:hypothetical protein